MRSSAANVKPVVVHKRVYPTDVDPAGIIDFSAYARFIDVAQTEFFRAAGFAHGDFERLAVSLPRVHVEFEFYRPARLDDELTLSTTVRGVGTHSVRLKIEIARRSDDARLAEATIVASCVDASHRSVALPSVLAEALRAQLSSS